MTEKLLTGTLSLNTTNQHNVYIVYFYWYCIEVTVLYYEDHVLDKFYAYYVILTK